MLLFSVLWLAVTTPLAFAQPTFAQPTPPQTAERGAPDPVFTRVPFDRWLAEGDQAPIHWLVRLSANELSNHQRIQARVDIQLDGNELFKRRGKGEMVTFVQLEDSAGAVYQSHAATKLSDVKAEATSVDVVYTLYAFVLPGDYRVSISLFDSATMEHNIAHRSLHVPSLKTDPLPDLWRSLPAVEFLSNGDGPDSLFLPYMRGRLDLPLESKRAVRIDLLVNVSSAEYDEAPRKAKPSSLTVLLPALKVISQTEVRNGTLNVSLLDLSRHRVSFEQDGVHELDWPKMKTALTEANPNVIDVHSLEKREQNAQFFVSEVRRRITEAAGGPLPVIIVLSGPMSFQGGEDLRPIDLSKSANFRIFYIRYHLPPVRPVLNPVPPVPSFSRRGTPPQIPHLTPPEPPDSLERTLKPLEPRLFDVDSPEQFRKALATVISEIARI